MLEKHEASITELRYYKTAIQIIIGLLLGGSIYTVLKFDDYIDERVARRVMKTDRIALALNQAQGGKWRVALTTLDEMRVEMQQTKDRNAVDPEFRRFVYHNLIWVLGEIDQLNPDGSWVGQTQYDILVKDQDFNREIFARADQGENAEMANSMGLCLLKYEQTPQGADRAYRYFVHATLGIEPPIDRANAQWNLGMLHLIRGELGSAADRVQLAASINPFLYRIPDLTTYKASFLNSTEFVVWSEISRRAYNRDFRTEYEALLAHLASQSP